MSNLTLPLNCTFSSINLTSLPVRSDENIVYEICTSSFNQTYYWLIVSLCIFITTLSLYFIFLQIIHIAKRKTYFTLFPTLCCFIFQLIRLILFIDWRGFRGVLSPLWSYLFSQVNYGILLGGASTIVLYWIMLIHKSRKKLKRDFTQLKKN